jgi:transaldolase
MSNESLRQLSEAGVAIWLDDLSRDRLATDSLRDLVQDRCVVGVTTNPTIFQLAVGHGQTYEPQIRDLALRGLGVEEALRMITTFDVRWACDTLRPVFDASGGVDGRISIEVDPRLAHDTRGTVAEARQLWWLVDRPNLFIKIPATDAGLPAISRCLAEGISVNVTLIFSLERYAAVIEAFLTGMELARSAGRDLAKLASVASFFISRVDTEIDKRLDKLGSEAAAELRGGAAVANARLAYQIHEDVFSSERWADLAGAGGHPQRPLWASTGVKDPAYQDDKYVVDLVANGVVNTMPEATLHAVADHGVVTGDTIRGSYAEAAQTLGRLAEVGIDFDEIGALLEKEGLEKFEASWTDLLELVADRLRHAARLVGAAG